MHIMHPELVASFSDFHCGVSTTSHRITQETLNDLVRDLKEQGRIARIKTPTMESSINRLHIKLGLMKNFVKAMDRTSPAFRYLHEKIPRLSKPRWVLQFDSSS